VIHPDLLSVATSVRARTEALVVAAGFKTSQRTLFGCCEFASFGLVEAAREAGFRGIYVVEGLYNDHRDQAHFWCQIGDVVVDLTATQFVEDAESVSLARVGSAPYAHFRRRCPKPSRIMAHVVRRCRIAPGWWREGAPLVEPHVELQEAS